jgi:hypothetical protein
MFNFILKWTKIGQKINCKCQKKNQKYCDEMNHAPLLRLFTVSGETPFLKLLNFFSQNDENCAAANVVGPHQRQFIIIFYLFFRSWQGTQVHPDQGRFPSGCLAPQELAQVAQEALRAVQPDNNLHNQTLEVSLSYETCHSRLFDEIIHVHQGVVGPGVAQSVYIYQTFFSQKIRGGCGSPPPCGHL